jgi:hypothetical protein
MALKPILATSPRIILLASTDLGIEHVGTFKVDAVPRAMLPSDRHSSLILRTERLPQWVASARGAARNGKVQRLRSAN